MLLKTLQWNIGGGQIRKPDDDPMASLAYCNEDFDAILKTIKQYDPDIITLQESHTDANGSQAQIISREMGFPYFANDVYAPSHLKDGQGLSQAVICRYPLANHRFESFLNPHFETTGPRGDHWVSHDKGVTICNAALPDGIILNIKTSHSMPYRKYNIDPLGDEFLPVKNDMMQKLQPESDNYLYQGDLNYNDASVKLFLPELFKNNVQEVVLSVPTTPKGRRYDHVLYRGIRHAKSTVIEDVLTDHFPIYSEFEI
jgi:endonuclease/exonuclease/phosphatase (EEP) superfamily protein YafD